MGERGGRRKTRAIARAFVLSLSFCFVLFFAGASSAADSADLSPPQAQGEAEDLRYERIIRETHELTGGHWSVEEIRSRMAELSEETAKMASPDVADQWGVSAAQARGYRDAVRHLINLYTVYISVLQNPQESPVASKPDEDLPPDDLSITRYDELREEYARLGKRLEDGNFALKTRAGEIAARTAAYKKQQELVASLAKNMNSADAQGFHYKQERLQAEADLVALSIGCTRMEVEFSYSRTAAITYQEMREQLRGARGHISFSEEELDRVLSEVQRTIAAREAELSRTVDELGKIGEGIARAIPHPEEYASLGQDVSQQRIALYRSAGDSPARAKTALLVARYAAERFRLYALSTEIDTLSNTTTLWRTRYNVLTGAVSGEAFWNARANAQLLLSEIDKDEQFIYRNLEDIQSNYLIVEDLTHKAKPETAATLHRILDVFTEIQMHMHSKIEMTLRAQRSLATGVVEESTEKIDGFRLAQRVAKVGRDFTRTYMNRVLWGDDDYEVTAYDLTLAVVIFVIGIFASSILSHLIVRAISWRRKVDRTFLVAIRRILFYLLVFFCFMLALDVINVPLTAFAFAGGTLALAIGFGAKDICSNQIGGLMILFSRPFKHGDIIEIDGTSGTVEEIGMRATRVMSFDGVEIMVPNSYFMEHKVVNFTKSGPRTRQRFRVRVAGDCDPKEIETILLKEIQDYRHPGRQLEPFVVLVDFSLRSLDFDIYYWIDIKRDNSLRITSRFRENILQKLRERGIRLYDPQEYSLAPPSKNIDNA